MISIRDIPGICRYCQVEKTGSPHIVTCDSCHRKMVKEWVRNEEIKAGLKPMKQESVI